MTAPESIVQAVMEVRGCEERGGKWRYCYWHGGTDGEWTERGCGEAVRMADAAFAASLEWAARSIGETQDHPKNAGMSDECYEGVTLAAILIRGWARGDR